MSQLLERFRLQLADSGDFRSGSWIVGAQGIAGITPTDFNEGDGSPLQAMLEGIVAYAGGVTGALPSGLILGDILYADAPDHLARLPGNVTTAKQFLSQVGTGTISAAPAWDALEAGDITTALGYTPVNRAGDTMTGFLSAHADPTSAMHYTTKQYVDALAAGIQLKDPVVAATTGNITLSGAQTIDGVSVIAGDRVLVKNQSAPAENGIYVAAAGAWSRSTDMDAGAEFTNALTFVQGGAVHGNEQWRVTTTGTITVGTTPVAWALFFASEDLSFTSPLVKVGTTVSITANGISNTLLRQSAALSVIGRSANSTGDVADIAAGTDHYVLRRSGTALGFGLLVDANISDVAWSKVTGTPTTLTGYGITDAQPLDADLTAIAALTTTGYLARTGVNTWSLSATIPWSAISSTPTTLAGYGITDAVPSARTISTTSPLAGGGDLSANRTLSIITNGIGNTLLRQSVALSVVGRSANTTGDVADIAAATDAHVLRRSGTALGFGTIGNASIADLAWSKITGTPTTLAGYGITDAVAVTRAINTTAPLTGGGNLSADRTLGIGGLSTLGTSNQIVGVNGAGTGWEYKTFTSTANQVTVTHGAGTVTFSTPQNIHTAATPTFAGLTVSGLTASRLLVSGTGGLLSVHAALTPNGFLYAGGAGALTSTAVPTNGQLLIGTGGAPTLGAITGTANRVTVTLGAGTISLSGPQDIHTAASPTFAGLTLSGQAGSTLRLLTVSSAGVVGNLSGTNRIPFLDASGNVVTGSNLIYDSSTSTLSTVNLSISGAFSTGSITSSGDWIYTQTTHSIRSNAADEADDRRLLITGGGSASVARGGLVQIIGNEFAGEGGSIYLQAGNITTGYLRFDTAGVERLRIENDGDCFYSGRFMGVGPNVSAGSVGTEAMRIGKDGTTTMMVMHGNGAGNNNLVWQFRHTNTPGVGTTGQAIDFYYEISGFVSGVEGNRRAARVRVGKENDFSTAANTNSFYAIYTLAANVEQLGFYQNRNGEVAIRHASPSCALDVNGNINTGGTFENASGYNRVISIQGTNHGRFRLRTSSGSLIDASFAADNTLSNGVSAFVGTTSGHPFSIYANGNPRMHFTTLGYVGVNTTAPQNFLGTTFVSAAQDRIFNIRSGTSGTNGGAILAVEGTQYADIWLGDQLAAANNRWMVLRTNDGFTSFLPHSDAGTTSSTAIQIRHSDGNLLTGRITNDFGYLNAFFNAQMSGIAYFQANDNTTVNIRFAPAGHANPYNYFRRSVMIGQDSTSPAELDVRSTSGAGVIAAFGVVSSVEGTYPQFMYMSNVNTFNSAYNRASDDQEMWLNYVGYNNGDLYYRNLSVGNGRRGVLALFHGRLGRVGINTGSPDYTLDVRGDFVQLYNTSGDARYRMRAGANTGYVGVETSENRVTVGAGGKIHMAPNSGYAARFEYLGVTDLGRFIAGGDGLTALHSTLMSAGSFAPGFISTAFGTGNPTNTRCIIQITNGGTITLPAASGCAGRMYFITSSTSSTVSMVTTGSDFIRWHDSDYGSLSIPSDARSFVLTSNGTNRWIVLATG